MLPSPHQLAALGTVLCVFREGGGELGGWVRAVRTGHVTSVDSDGLREGLLFYDAGDACCWRLYLLPDTDFIAWEALCGHAPASAAAAQAGVGERLWRHIAARVGKGAWRANVLRLHALPSAPGFAALPTLAASPAPVSGLGADLARRILRKEGIEGGIDDCCCRQSAPGHTMAHPDAPYPLVRFKPRLPA